MDRECVIEGEDVGLFAENEHHELAVELSDCGKLLSLHINVVKDEGHCWTVSELTRVYLDRESAAELSRYLQSISGQDWTPPAIDT